MKSILRSISWVALFVLPLTAGWAAKSTPDVFPPLKRRAAVEMAETLTRPPTPAPVPEGLKSPFNPPDFDRPVEDPKPRAGEGPQKPAAPGDLEILETLAARIPNAATIGLPGGNTLLLIGKTKLQVGDAFTVTNPANNQDYELQLVAVTSTTFTLRYRDHEVTRPTRTAK